MKSGLAIGDISFYKWRGVYHIWICLSIKEGSDGEMPEYLLMSSTGYMGWYDYVDSDLRLL